MISSSPTDVQPVFDAIARSAAQLCERTLRRSFSSTARCSISWPIMGTCRRGARGHPQRLSRRRRTGGAPRAGRFWQRRRRAHSATSSADPDYTLECVAGSSGLPEYPGRADAARRPRHRDDRGRHARDARPLLRRQIDLLQTFADQAVIAIENVRLFKELEARNHDLTETLEQQTATGEILRVISSSPTDVQPVFDTIAQSAARLCAAADAAIWQREGDRLRVVASLGALPMTRRELTISRQSVVGRAVNDRRAVHVEDLAEAFHEEFPDSASMRALGYRTILAMPLVREGERDRRHPDPADRGPPLLRAGKWRCSRRSPTRR